MNISPREAEVLAMVGDHLSNAEIGARLFISVRTVESHVSSLLHKFRVPDRRALAQADTSRPAPVLPVPLTSFIGRERERAELTEMIRSHRQVTAFGPGGVGKTRLVLTVAEEVATEYADGVWFVDLVPVTDPAMVAAAAATAVGLGEQPRRAMSDTVVAALADRHALLVLDNCEQVRDGVALFVERLLAACPRLTVLTTSRARLMVPFERAFPVPPLSLAGDSDAVALFVERAEAVGPPLDPQPLREQVAAICERLDGMALAIELAAARYPSLGLDGLTAALSQPLRMLTGGSRAAERHRSVRAALDWSHALLKPADRTLLRRVSVFVMPFTTSAAAQVAGGDHGVVADGLARLAEHSLLVVTPSMGGTRYRALETIRQYGTEHLVEAGDLTETRARHLAWCLDQAMHLAVAGPDWRSRFDVVADDLRAALAWAMDELHRRTEAYQLARHLAELTFTRNLTGESQQRYEQAAALADDSTATASMLRYAAGVAGSRLHGDDMYRLHCAAADAASLAGDSVGAARDLATAAMAVYRFDTKFEQIPPREEPAALIARAQDLCGDDPAARAAVALAEAGRALTEESITDDASETSLRETMARAQRAVELARRSGDPLASSAALDTLTAAQSCAGDTIAAAATAQHRIRLLASAPDSPAKTQELIDALAVSMEASLDAGDLPNAHQWARQLADHPALVEVGHSATTWLMVADALAGNVDEVLTVSARFLDTWRRAGGPARPGLGPPAAGVAMIHGLRDDHAARREWTAILNQLDASPRQTHGYGAVFDAIVMLHHGQAAEALERMEPEPAKVRKRTPWIWFHWYVALRAEASVLARTSDADTRLTAARDKVTGNPVAAAIVERAEALYHSQPQRLLATTETFDAAGYHYQSARTLVLAGGDHAARGAAALTRLGLASMAPTDNPVEKPTIA